MKERERGSVKDDTFSSLVHFVLLLNYVRVVRKWEERHVFHMRSPYNMQATRAPNCKRKDRVADPRS